MDPDGDLGGAAGSPAPGTIGVSPDGPREGYQRCLVLPRSRPHSSVYLQPWGRSCPHWRPPLPCSLLGASLLSVPLQGWGGGHTRSPEPCWR